VYQQETHILNHPWQQLEMNSVYSVYIPWISLRLDRTKIICLYHTQNKSKTVVWPL